MKAGLFDILMCLPTDDIDAYLLTGSLMAVKKSCACSAIGEKASRMICPSSGLIHSGREA